MDQKSPTRRRLLQAVAIGGTVGGLMKAAPGFAQNVLARGRDAVARDIPFDADWCFGLGDFAGAELSTFDDSAWRRLDLPHDWSIEDRPGAPKTADPWLPPVALWNPNPPSKDAQPIAPGFPVPAPIVPAPAPGGPPRKVGPFDVDESAGGWMTGWTVGGVGWYRKHFTIADLTPDEQVELRFDGAYCETEVWLNGVELGRNLNGYLGFAFDLTPHLQQGRNVLAVRVGNVGRTSRWYSGSGLYRHVWLSRTGQLRIPLWGASVTTVSTDDTGAKLAIKVELENRGPDRKTVACGVVIRTMAGRVVASAQRQISLDGKGTSAIEQELGVVNPSLWSPETPTLHYAEISLEVDGRKTDVVLLRFGIRTVSASPTTGFLINGRPYKLRGACLHNDNGLIGAAAIDRAERRKVELLKANGFNAIRCSHNPYSPQFLDACDELGMIVIDEAFDHWEEDKLFKSKYFLTTWRQDLTAMINRDRNHPSVAFWSIGNEIPEVSKPRGVELAADMRALVRELDPSRLITNALTPDNAGKVGEGARGQLDVVGYNYSLDAVTGDHATYPQLIFAMTESFARDAAEINVLVEKMPSFIGSFVWSGIDYLGEIGVGGSRLRPANSSSAASKITAPGGALLDDAWFAWDYPAYVSGSGDIDILGGKKPRSFFHDVVWGRSKLEVFVQRPTPPGAVEHLTAWGWPDELPSWTWPVEETTSMTVRVYTTGDQVALLLNGRPLARKSVPPGKLKVELDVPYSAGVLTAVAYADGREIARKHLETLGAPAKLRLRAEREMIGGGPGELAFVFAEVCDAQGRLLPDAAVPLTFRVQGQARLLAAGSANPRGLESFTDPYTRSFQGKALAILQPRTRRGVARLDVASPGLASAEQVILIG